MKAARFHQYGDADVLQIDEVARPEPKRYQVRIRVSASSLNAGDIGGRQGNGRPVHAGRLPHIPGYDVAGTVDVCGPSVTAFVPGDTVYALTGLGAGGQAEYICLPQDRVGSAPTAISLVEAASVPLAGLTALQGLYGKASVQPGQRLLIVGAAGGVGTFAVQLGKLAGCHVTAVCRATKAADIRALGADATIDHTIEDFSQRNEHWDAIFDASGQVQFTHATRVLTPKGVMVATRPDPQSLLISKLPGSTQRYTFIITQARGHDLTLLSRLIDRGKLHPLIDRTFPLADVRAANRYYEAGTMRGKIVVTIQ